MGKLMFIPVKYCATIVGSASGEGGLGALEKALLSFEQRGVNASIDNSTPSSVTIRVYVSIAKPARDGSPLPVTGQTAEAYTHLIQTIRECGYTAIEEHREGRTGLEEISETPLFEVVDAQ